MMYNEGAQPGIQKQSVTWAGLQMHTYICELQSLARGASRNSSIHYRTCTGQHAVIQSAVFLITL